MGYNEHEAACATRRSINSGPVCDCSRAVVPAAASVGPLVEHLREWDKNLEAAQGEATSCFGRKDYLLRYIQEVRDAIAALSRLPVGTPPWTRAEVEAHLQWLEAKDKEVGWLDSTVSMLRAALPLWPEGR